MGGFTDNPIRQDAHPQSKTHGQMRFMLALPVGVPEKLALLNVLSLCADQPALETAQRYLADPATAEAARDAVDAITSNLAGTPTCQVSNSAADLAHLTDGKPGTILLLRDHTTFTSCPPHVF